MRKTDREIEQLNREQNRRPIEQRRKKNAKEKMVRQCNGELETNWYHKLDGKAPK